MCAIHNAKKKTISKGYLVVEKPVVKVGLKISDICTTTKKCPIPHHKYVLSEFTKSDLSLNYLLQDKVDIQNVIFLKQISPQENHIFAYIALINVKVN